MNSSCAKSHMSLPLPVHTLKRVLTLRTSLYTYIYIYSQIYIFHITNTFVYDSVLCERLCPCECSQLEPLCIHTYAHKYTFFILQILLCMTPCCANSANSHMSAPLRVLTVRTSFIHRYTHKYTYFILQILLYVNPCCANSHMSVPLRVLTVRTSLYTCIYSEIYIYHITNTFICEPMLCELTYVCAPASART